MPRFAANLSLMYAEWAFPARFDAAAADGFTGVECQFPYAHPAPLLARALADAGLQQVLINAPPGEGEERGLAALPGRQADFRRAFLDQAVPYAQALACPRIHVMAGLIPPGVERAALQPTFIENLAWAAEQAAPLGITLLVEPLNARDVPGYFLNRQDHAHEIVAAVGARNLAVQMDLYHVQIVEGDISAKLRRYLDPAHPTRVGHLQVASVPDRHEPEAGELDFDHLFSLIDTLGWEGWVGAEYRPRVATRDGLGWYRRWRQGST